MEPNNIENQFRDKLNKREISPSENSWDRLDAMLTVAEKPKRNYRWMYFAASFLGFILIATVFLSQTEEVIDSEHQKVVTEQNKMENTESTLDNVLEIPSKNNSTELVSTAEKATVKQQNKDVVTSKVVPLIKEKPSHQIAVVTNIKNNSSSIINQKAEVKVDAHALLASVDTQKTKQKNEQNTIVVKVNSNDLLSQVDDELELSFRERMLQSVNKRFREVKVAVANRNVE
ncbi:hypothetical protein [Flavobacterium sp. SM2513]|uniref:hypothetical protein n=1 Tax=Flavobacterium sp. SM2513 TaxID=3424766 RepID=UPI003D7FDFF5